MLKVFYSDMQKQVFFCLKDVENVYDKMQKCAKNGQEFEILF